MNEERDYAAKRLMAFLQLVGPVEAAWAMSTALEALEALPAGGNHLEAAELALAESMAAPEHVASAAADQTAPPSTTTTGAKGGKGS
jgi:hypothetical protein